MQKRMTRLLILLLSAWIAFSVLSADFHFSCEFEGNEFVEGTDDPLCYCYGPGNNETIFDWTLVHDAGRWERLGTCYGVGNCTTLSPDVRIQMYDIYSTLLIPILTSWFSGILTCTQSNSSFNGSANYTIKIARVNIQNCIEDGGLFSIPEGDNMYDIICRHSPYTPSIVTWTITSHSGHPLQLGSCNSSANYNCTSLYSPNIMLTDASTSSMVDFENGIVNRDMASAVCSVTFSDSKNTDNCTLDIYNPAVIENCSVHVCNHNWSFVISCEVTNTYSTRERYELRVAEMFYFQRRDQYFSADGYSFDGYRSIRQHLVPYINSTNNRQYYRGRVVLTWPISPYSGYYTSFSVQTFYGSYTQISLLEVINISQPVRPTHNCSDVITPCSCSTETLGSPAGRLLWLIGNTTVAVGDYGVKELLLSSDNLPDGHDVTVATCHLDWIQPLIAQQPVILRSTHQFKSLAIAGWTVSCVVTVLFLVFVATVVHQGRLSGWPCKNLLKQQKEETESSSYNRLEK